MSQRAQRLGSVVLLAMFLFFNSTKVIKNMTEVLVESVELQLNHRTLGQNFTIEIGEPGSRDQKCILSLLKLNSMSYIFSPISSPRDWNQSAGAGRGDRLEKRRPRRCVSV